MGEEKANLNHPLHQKVGKILQKLNDDQYEVIRDPACGGKQNIPLFLTRRKGNDTEICNVDALIIDKERDKVIAVIEIEETNILPSHIAGKFLTIALAKYFIHYNQKDKPYPLKDILFLHILKSPSKEKSKKKKQVEYLKKSIWNHLRLCNFSVNDYDIIWDDDESFENLILEKIKDI